MCKSVLLHSLFEHLLLIFLLLYGIGPTAQPTVAGPGVLWSASHIDVSAYRKYPLLASVERN